MTPEKYLILLLPIFLTGCFDLNFGPNISTTQPTAEMVQTCRAEMYMNPDIVIEPEGFKLFSGIDDFIYFRFIAKTSDINNLFDTSVVDTTKFKSDYKIDALSQDSWWDPSTKNLTGGHIRLPNVRFMNVAYLKNQDDTLTVYVTWHTK